MATETVKAGPRVRLKAEDRKREILTAASEVFSSKGYDRTSIAEIAAKVGIVEGAVYKHFATKRELLFETMRMFYGPIIEQTREHLANVRGTRNRLRFVIGSQLRAFAEEPGVCRLIIQDVRPYQDYRDSVVHELNRASTSIALGIIEEAMESGEFRNDLPATMVRDVIYGGIEHVMWKALSGRSAPDVERLADQLTDLIVSGVQAEAPQAAEQVGIGERMDSMEKKLDRLLEQGS